jgi:hypothetical protein
VVAAPVEIAAVVVSHASIADVVYDDDGDCFMFKNVDAINDSEYLSTADLRKFNRAMTKTETKYSKKLKKRCRTTIDVESSGVLGVRVHNRKQQFFVQWADRGYQTWEPIENVSNLIGVMNYLSSSHNEVIHVK